MACKILSRSTHPFLSYRVPKSANTQASKHRHIHTYRRFLQEIYIQMENFVSANQESKFESRFLRPYVKGFSLKKQRKLQIVLLEASVLQGFLHDLLRSALGLEFNSVILKFPVSVVQQSTLQKYLWFLQQAPAT